jgi:hypothetical protein
MLERQILESSSIRGKLKTCRNTSDLARLLHLILLTGGDAWAKSVDWFSFGPATK